MEDVGDDDEAVWDVAVPVLDAVLEADGAGDERGSLDAMRECLNERVGD